MARAYVSIGSNIERESSICSCIRELRANFENVAFSDIYSTPAEGFVGEPFLNLAAGFDTSLDPVELRLYLRDLEDRNGRVRTQDKFAPRTLDVDLLLYDDLDLRPAHNVPHSDILAYPFVLFPLAEIAASASYPGSGKRIAQLARESALDRSGLQKVTLPCLKTLEAGK